MKRPKNSVGLAELVGVILGDGHVSYYNPKKKTATYHIRIVGNSVKDEEYVLNYLRPLVKRLFNLEPYIHYSKVSKAIYLTIPGKSVVEFFIDLGLKPGNKIKNQLGIPDWIKENKKFLKCCIRGLFDTDGCMYELRPNWPGLFQINFKNYNEKLMLDTRSSLLRLNFHVSKVSYKQIFITRKADIHKFYKEIGFSNPRLLNKYLEFSKLNPIAPSSSGQG